MLASDFYKLDYEEWETSSLSGTGGWFSARLLPAGEDACLELSSGGLIAIVDGRWCPSSHPLARIAATNQDLLRRTYPLDEEDERVLICGKYFMDESAGAWRFAAFIERCFVNDQIQLSRAYEGGPFLWEHPAGKVWLMSTGSIHRSLHVVARLKVEAMVEFQLEEDGQQIEGLMWLAEPPNENTPLLVSRRSTWLRDAAKIGSVIDYGLTDLPCDPNGP